MTCKTVEWMAFTPDLNNTLAMELRCPSTALWTPCKCLPFSSSQPDESDNVHLFGWRDELQATPLHKVLATLPSAVIAAAQSWNTDGRGQGFSKIDADETWRPNEMIPQIMCIPSDSSQGQTETQARIWTVRVTRNEGFFIVPMLVTVDPDVVVCIVVPISPCSIEYKYFVDSDHCEAKKNKRGEITFFPRLMAANCLSLLNAPPGHDWFTPSALPSASLLQNLLLLPTIGSVRRLAVTVAQILRGNVSRLTTHTVLMTLLGDASTLTDEACLQYLVPHQSKDNGGYLLPDAGSFVAPDTRFILHMPAVVAEMQAYLVSNYGVTNLCSDTAGGQCGAEGL